MATITSAGEILTVAENSDDKRREKNQYVQYNKNDKKRTVVTQRILKDAEKNSRKKNKKFDIDGVPFESDDSEYDCSDDSENDDDGFYTACPISPPSSPRVQSDEGFEVAITPSLRSTKNNESTQSKVNPVEIHDPTTLQGVSSKESEGSAISDTTPIILHDPTPAPSGSSHSRSENIRLSALNNASPLNCNDRAISLGFASDKSEGSMYSEKSLQRDNVVSDRDASTSRKGRLSIFSESTPIHFHEPAELDKSISLRSGRSNESELSETTPIKFYESTQMDFDWESSDSSHNSNATPMKLDKGASRRTLGMSYAEKKASQRFEAELLDDAIEEDAERDIVNVYLEASAFADRERINLTEDIYSFVLACSFFSRSFWTAIYFILVKYLCYGVIFVNLTKKTYKGEGTDPAVLATKFIMIPVAVAMQEDLITVYYNAANKKYDALTYKGNMYATEAKWILSNLLRAIDGVLSLAVNFGVMLLETDLLTIFLSFAALHFLQFIDDVIYELAEKGFFGHKLEQATIACKIITFTRRTHSGNRCNNFITNLDTILLLGSMALCIAIYGCFLLFYYIDEDKTLFGLEEEELDGFAP